MRLIIMEVDLASGLLQMVKFRLERLNIQVGAQAMYEFVLV